MKSLRILCLTMIVTFAGGYTAHAFLLDDGGFDLADHQSDVSNSDWSLVANKPDGTDLSTRFQVSGFARSDGAGGSGAGVWYRAFEGNQGGSGQDLAESTLTQSVVAPGSGDYVLQFDWAREEFFTATRWDVSLSSSGTGGSATFDALNATGNTGFNFNQLLVEGFGPNVATLSLTGVTAGDTLTVTATMEGGEDALGGAQSAFLDNFVLVPEPSSAILVTLTLLAATAFRRRR